MIEIWKDIEPYKNIYQVSNLGRIKSLLYNKEKILKTRVQPRGYELVNLKGKTFKVHRLVAEAFVLNNNNYNEVNHKDENKLNNYANNLEWCNRKYNCNYGSLPKKVGNRFSKKIIMIDEESENKPIVVFPSAMEAERIMKIDHSSIIKCCKGKVKQAGGFTWKYEKEVVSSEIRNN